MDDGHISGMVSALDRSSPLTWEIDFLLFDSIDSDTCLTLLETLSIAAAEKGVTKVFLRLPQDSPMLSVAAKADFCPYVEERLFRAKGISFMRADSSCTFYPWAETDTQALFQLYCQVVPAKVRSVEGMTLEEWKVSREPAPGRSQQFAYYQGSDFIGWLRTSKFGRRGAIDLLARSNHLEDMLAYGMRHLRHRSSISLLVPGFQSELYTLLEEHKFERAGNFVSLVKQTTRRVPETQLAPLRV